MIRRRRGVSSMKKVQMVPGLMKFSWFAAKEKVVMVMEISVMYVAWEMMKLYTCMMCILLNQDTFAVYSSEHLYIVVLRVAEQFRSE